MNLMIQFVLTGNVYWKIQLYLISGIIFKRILFQIIFNNLMTKKQCLVQVISSRRALT